ncbi:MAG: peptidase D-alanyl-D-alanine carboxypeptidase 1 [Chthoniobacteraceae bacterium]|nr:peptidase D-alanyl-D-alanine carboxypeptidase 1 [Chthoniobacteraceae bacterium]
MLPIRGPVEAIGADSKLPLCFRAVLPTANSGVECSLFDSHPMATSRFLTILSAAALLIGALFEPAKASAQAAAYVISDNTTGYVLESSNPEKKLQIGSLTKIATAMVVLDWAAAKESDLAQMATVPDSAQALSAESGIGLHPGDQVSLRDLLYAAMMQSDNQAAETLASHVGRTLITSGVEITSVNAFVAQMNALARRLGMNRTRFLNPHGLDSIERTLPYSTAEDLAKLTRYAMSNSAFLFYVSQKERKITIQTSAAPSQYLLRNTNELLGTQSIDGVKTGTTRKAGPCVIISAGRPPESRQEGESHIITPRRLNIIVLNARDRFPFAAQQLARGWKLYDAWAAAGRPIKGKQAAR